MGVLYSYTVVFTVGLCEDCPDDCYNAFPMAHNKLHCSPPTLQTDREDRQTDRQTDNGPMSYGEPFYKRSPENQLVTDTNLKDTVRATLNVLPRSLW